MTGGARRACASAALALAAAAASICGAAAQETGAPASSEAVEAVDPSWGVVRIGVRVDAMPFAWRDLKPEQDEDVPVERRHLIFRGFLVDLCSKAAIHARYRPEMVSVSADQRREFLRGLETGETPAEERFDVLCDPTTLSLSRMYRMSVDERFVFSPIVFVANSSYVQPDPFALTDAKAAGKWAEPEPVVEPPAVETVVADTTTPELVDPAVDEEPPAGTARVAEAAEPSPEPMCVAGGDPAGPVYTAGFVTGTTAEESIKAAMDLGVFPANAKQYCARSFKSHRDGMEAVCSGTIGYYFGDIDIISSYEKEINGLPGKSCKLNYTRDFLIYEPYALLVGKGKDNFRQKFIRELYRLFSDGTVEDAFAAYFPDRRSSEALTMLFRINGVPIGSLPDVGAGGVDQTPTPAAPNGDDADETSGRTVPEGVRSEAGDGRQAAAPAP